MYLSTYRTYIASFDVTEITRKHCIFALLFCQIYCFKSFCILKWTKNKKNILNPTDMCMYTINACEYSNRRCMHIGIQLFYKISYVSPYLRPLFFKSITFFGTFSNKNWISSCARVFRYKHKTHVVNFSFSSVFKTHYFDLPASIGNLIQLKELLCISLCAI